MPRKRISEYKAKLLLFKALGKPYPGLHVTPQNYKNLSQEVDKGNKYVLKVDQGIKKRFKKGLIGINIKRDEISGYAEQFSSAGFSSYLLEEYLPHKSQDERYIAFERVRNGVKIYYSKKGGVDIEDNHDSVRVFNINEDADIDKFISKSNMDITLVDAVLMLFKSQHVAFLEINPLVFTGVDYNILDLAVEVDSAAEYFVDGWDESDLIEENLNDKKTIYEKNVELLSEKSSASFRLNVLNKDGSIFMLLSGGGASIVLADEAYQLGMSDSIANYGEYSGNPNIHETFMYTKNVLELLLASKSKEKVVVIAGGAANFTDVYNTFQGVIRALERYKTELKKSNVKIYVRRGGPNEEKGLLMMKNFLAKNNLLGKVCGSEYIMTNIISDAVENIRGE